MWALKGGVTKVVFFDELGGGIGEGALLDEIPKTYLSALAHPVLLQPAALRGYSVFFFSLQKKTTTNDWYETGMLSVGLVWGPERGGGGLLEDAVTSPWVPPAAGVDGMREGETRRLVIPPAQAEGAPLWDSPPLGRRFFYCSKTSLFFQQLSLLYFPQNFILIFSPSLDPRFNQP